MGRRQHRDPAPLHSHMDFGVLDTEGTMYHEQYDEYRVLIERPDGIT